MSERSSYDRTRERLEEIVTQVKAKDVPLEKSLELYEEALRLGNVCAEMIDRTDFSVEELELAGVGRSDEASGEDEETEDEQVAPSLSPSKSEDGIDEDDEDDYDSEDYEDEVDD